MTKPTLPEDEPAICIGAVCVLPRSRRLAVDGTFRDIGSRAFDILMLLIKARGAVVGREEITARVWPGIHVADMNLRVQIAALRQSLGSCRDLVKTIPGRGYLFVGDVARPSSVAPLPAPGDRPSTNLPRSRDALVGRAEDLRELRKLLETARLVSLVGVGGMGKTRLATACGWEVLPNYPGGVWRIDLAPLIDGALVASAAASAMAIALPPAQDPVDAIVAAIGRQRRLLIFDNCEHLVEPTAALVEAFLRRLPGLTAVATSQELLRIAGETVYRVRPLAVPPADAAAAAGYGAVDLFVARARAADHGFTLDAANGGAVAAICRALDGIPLAIEMAAARLPLLGIEGLREGLAERDRMLRVGPRAIEGRHSTLRSMLEWSHGLLDHEQQRFFRRLAVFAGSFSLEAALAVAGDDAADRWDSIDVLGTLIEKSLVAVEPGEPPRYRLLETLRLFARRKLEESGEVDAIAERHVRHLTAYFEVAHTAWQAMLRPDWRRHYVVELDDLRVAMDWALAEPARAPLAIGLMAVGGRLWEVLNLRAEGRRYIERVIERIGPETPARDAVLVLYRGAGILTDTGAALTLAERAVALSHEIDDPVESAIARTYLGEIYTHRGRFDEARALFAGTAEILAAANRPKAVATCLGRSGVLAALTGDFASARTCFTGAAEAARSMKDTIGEAYFLRDLAELEYLSGETDRAIEIVREVVRRDRHIPEAVGNLAVYLVAKGDLPEARIAAEQALELAREAGTYPVMVALHLWVLLGALDGRCAAAARLLGFVDAFYATSGQLQQPSMLEGRERIMTVLEAALSPADIEACTKEGASLNEEQAIFFTFEDLISARA